jgi:hypothetical protein
MRGGLLQELLLLQRETFWGLTMPLGLIGTLLLASCCN